MYKYIKNIISQNFVQFKNLSAKLYKCSQDKYKYFFNIPLYVLFSSFNKNTTIIIKRGYFADNGNIFFIKHYYHILNIKQNK